MPGRKSTWNAEREAACRQAFDNLKREKDGEIERLLALAEARLHEINRLRTATDAAMVWAIDLAPQSPPAPKVWRCRGCSQRGEYPARIEHGPTCPFGKIAAALEG